MGTFLQRQWVAAVAGAAVSVVGLGAAVGAPAQAATDGTPVTFTLAAGAGAGLTISVPKPAGASTHISLGAAAAGGSTPATGLGTVTVYDSRGWVSAPFTVTAKASSFALVGGGGYTLPASVVEYRSDVLGGLGNLVGNGTVTGVHAAYLAAAGQNGLTGALLSESDLGIMSGLTTGTGQGTLAPQIVVHMPADAPTGDYTGTITHSVS